MKLPVDLNSKQAPGSEEQSEDYFKDFNEVPENSISSKRLLLLVPYNLSLLYGTWLYMKNIKKVGKVLWPKQSQRGLVNLFFYATLQALGFFSVFAYGNLAIMMGPNPLSWKSQISENKMVFDETGVKMVVWANQYMGVSDETL